MRWLLASVGSSGDLHPFLALGRELLARGHRVSLVGHAEWRAETEANGIRFLDSGEPPRGEFLREHPELLSTRWNGLVSFRTLMARLAEPGLRPILRALLAAAPEHDALVAHHFVFPAPLVAEMTGLPWITVTLAPGVIPSAWTLPGGDYGRVVEAPHLRHRLTWGIGRRIIARVVDPMVNRLRAEQGLPPARDVVFAHSPRLNLQLTSSHFAPRPPDWGPEVRQTGFCFYDPPGASPLPPAVETFLESGEPPVLATLGSTVVQAPGPFYGMMAEALRALGRRGLFLAGREAARLGPLPPGILAVDYLPHGRIMPRARAVAHQCGIGTLAQVLRAGVPSLACPFAFDQPNNARRLEALGVARVVRPREQTARRFAEELAHLLEGPASVRAQGLAEQVRAENGAARAADVLEEAFR